MATCLGQYGIDFRYLLAVATWEPRKNLGMLVETFLAMKRDRELGGRKLVLVGGRGWKDRRLASLVDSAGKSAICCPGYVPDEDLPAIYSGADAFIFPSQYEGFGIPVSEARACGTRVVASDIPEIREAGGPDPEVIYVQPTSQGLREGIEKILGREGTEPAVRPERPGWDAAAQIYAEALAGSR